MTKPETRVPIPSGGKRLGMERSAWMNDWFVSHSPRNDNSNAEGPWDHWVDLAVQILQHPATELVRPEARAAVAELEPKNFYSEASRDLSEEECERLFGPADESW